MFAVYLVAALVLSMYLARNTRRKLFGFLLLVWILAQPVITYQFSISIPVINIDLQANRIMLLFLAMYMFFVPPIHAETGLKSTDKSEVNKPFSLIELGKTVTAPMASQRIERYMYSYLVIVTLSVLVNIFNIGRQEVITIPLEIITFILMYKASIRYVDEALMRAILNAIVVLCLVGVCISFVQYGVDSDFMRTTGARVAFGDISRASGIFSQEYDFGAFQVLGAITILLRFKGSAYVYVLVSFVVASIMLTFHRMDIITLMMCLLIYTWYFTSATKKIMVMFLAGVLSLSIVVFLPFLTGSVGDTSFAKTASGRLQQNTVSGRFDQYGVALNAIFTNYRNIVGMGSYTNKRYDDLMISNGHLNITKDGQRYGYRMHNGYLEVGILYGFMAMFVFMTILIKMLFYFKKMGLHAEPVAMLPFFAILIWMFVNLSNGLSSFNIYYSLMCAVLTGVFVGAHQKNLIKRK